MKLIVGLGNPEMKYAFTRHNMGFSAIDLMLDKLGGLTLDNTKFNGCFTKIKYENEDIIISKPLTYMNLSGDFVRDISNFYKIDPKDIIVIYDELALPVGRIRITKTGSAGGHNGIKSIIKNLGTESFIKVRIGIGEDTVVPQLDFVLMKYTVDEYRAQMKNVERAVEGVFDIIKNGVEHAMNNYNQSPKE